MYHGEDEATVRRLTAEADQYDPADRGQARHMEYLVRQVDAERLAAVEGLRLPDYKAPGTSEWQRRTRDQAERRYLIQRYDFMLLKELVGQFYEL